MLHNDIKLSFETERGRKNDTIKNTVDNVALTKERGQNVTMYTTHDGC